MSTAKSLEIKRPEAELPRERPEHLHEGGGDHGVCIGLPQSHRDFVADGTRCRNPRAMIRTIAEGIIPGMLSDTEIVAWFLERSGVEAGLSREEIRQIVEKAAADWLNSGDEPPDRPE